MSILSTYTLGVLFVCLILYRRKLKRKREQLLMQEEYDEWVESWKNEGARFKNNDISLDKYAPPRPKEEKGVYGALLSAFRSLKAQRVSGMGPWLSSCIERIQKGGRVPRKIALRALYMTRDELTGRRFNLDGVNDAIVTLEGMTGEWD